MAQNIQVCDDCKITSFRVDDQLWDVIENAINSETCHCKCLFAHQKSGINVQPPALTVAAILNHTECVKTLIEAGADVNVTTAQENFVSQRTALSLAAQMGHTESVNVLIAAGADVNKMEDKQFTPLTFAAQGGQSECIKILIDAGADVNMGTGMELNDIGMRYYECKRTALMWLFIPESPVCRYTDSTFYHLTEDRCRALSRKPNREECVDILLEAGADVNKVDRRTCTALRHAARLPDQTRCVKKLLDAGANVNLVGPRSDSPIIMALSNHCDKNLELILKAGADVNGESVLLMASFANSRCVKLLLKTGLRINTRDMSFISDKVIKEFHAAGVTSIRDNQIPDYVKQEDEKRHLKHLCLVRIRNHLLELDPHENLFIRVPQLGLPKSLTSYLMYDVTVDDVSDDCDNGDDSVDDVSDDNGDD